MYEPKYTAIIACCVISILITVTKSENVFDVSNHQLLAEHILEKSKNCYTSATCNNQCDGLLTMCIKNSNTCPGYSYYSCSAPWWFAIIAAVCLVLYGIYLCCLGRCVKRCSERLENRKWVTKERCECTEGCKYCAPTVSRMETDLKHTTNETLTEMDTER